jgi:hypothetical protein
MSDKFTAFKSIQKKQFYNEVKINMPNEIFIKKVVEILTKHIEPISSSTLRMKLGDMISNENLPPKGKFNDWMMLISGIVKDDTMQVDMPYYKLIKPEQVQVPVVVPVVVPVAVPVAVPVSEVIKSTNHSDLDSKIIKTVNRVKTKHSEWIVAWNKFNTEEPSIEQWEILHERYTDLNKKIQTVKNFYGKNINLIKEYYPNNMPKRPSDTLVYQITPKVENKTEPIINSTPPPITPIPGSLKDEIFINTSISNLPQPPGLLQPIQQNNLLPQVQQNNLLPTIQSLVTETRPQPMSYNSILFPSSSPQPSVPLINQYTTNYQASQFSSNNGLNIFESTKPIPNLFQSQSQSQLPIPTLPPSNIFDNKDMYITLLKLRNYGLMERGTLAEKALILIEQNIK